MGPQILRMPRKTAARAQFWCQQWATLICQEFPTRVMAGSDHIQTPGVAQCLKLMSKKGCERIVRLAFEVAVAEGRRSVHCATRANLMKLTEGLMKRTFEEVAHGDGADQLERTRRCSGLSA